MGTLPWRSIIKQLHYKYSCQSAEWSEQDGPLAIGPKEAYSIASTMQPNLAGTIAEQHILPLTQQSLDNQSHCEVMV